MYATIVHLEPRFKPMANLFAIEEEGDYSSESMSVNRPDF